MLGEMTDRTAGVVLLQKLKEWGVEPLKEESPIIVEAIISPDMPLMTPEIERSQAFKSVWPLFSEKVD